jgi:hypothetical protein
MADRGFFASRGGKNGLCVAVAALVLVGAACGSPSRPPTTVGNRFEESGAAAESVKLTWVVRDPSVPHQTYEDILLRPVELEITIGSSLQKVPLKPQMGSLFPYHQGVCNTTTYPRRPGEVAKITFEEGGAFGYLVRRRPQYTLEVVDWSQSDGACTDEKTGDMVACAPSYQLVTKIQIPANARVDEALVEVNATGVRVPMRCEEPQ